MPAWRPLAGLIRSLSAPWGVTRHSPAACGLHPQTGTGSSPTRRLEVERMLADELDYVIGVDTHRDAHALAIVRAGTGGAVGSSAGHGERARATRRRCASPSGRRLVDAAGRSRARAPTVPGSPASWPSAASGCSRSARTRRERRSQRQDGRARRAPGCPQRARRGAARRARAPAGEREALRALMVARAGALAAKKAGLCQLRALLVTCPEPLRSELR